jgi:hypothetical protein
MHFRSIIGTDRRLASNLMHMSSNSFVYHRRSVKLERYCALLMALGAMSQLVIVGGSGVSNGTAEEGELIYWHTFLIELMVHVYIFTF